MWSLGYMFTRVIVNLLVWCANGSASSSVTETPASPRMVSTACVNDRFTALEPSMDMRKYPDLIPARAAGDPGRDSPVRRGWSALRRSTRRRPVPPNPAASSVDVIARKTRTAEIFAFIYAIGLEPILVLACSERNSKSKDSHPLATAAATVSDRYAVTQHSSPLLAPKPNASR